MSTTRQSPSSRSAASDSMSRAAWRLPMRPLAKNGRVGTADERPTIASPSRRRTKGKSLTVLPSLAIHGPSDVESGSMELRT